MPKPRRSTPSTASSRSRRSQGSPASSKRHVFPYVAVVSNAPVKPAIPVTLRSTDATKSFPLHAIPDSGADTSCFPEDWAEVLGIDLKGCRERQVITGAGIGCHYESDSPLHGRIAGIDVELCACFGPVHVGLLGRQDFFRYFHVAFDERSKLTILRAFLAQPE